MVTLLAALSTLLLVCVCYRFYARYSRQIYLARINQGPCYLPERSGSGFIIRAPYGFRITRSEFQRISLNWCVMVPEGHAAIIYPQCVAFKLVHATGIIDCGYRGEVYLYLRGVEDGFVSAGHKIAHMVIVPELYRSKVLTIAEFRLKDLEHGGYGNTGLLQ